jgi:hypothetical protein
MRGISIKAVLLATLAVLGIDFIRDMLLIGAYGTPLDHPTDDQLKAAAAALFGNETYLTASIVLGTASTILGGYLVARLAPSVPYFNALAFGLLGALLSVVFEAAAPVKPPAWASNLALMLGIPAALLGAWLSKRLRAAEDEHVD